MYQPPLTTAMCVSGMVTNEVPTALLKKSKDGSQKCMNWWKMGCTKCGTVYGPELQVLL